MTIQEITQIDNGITSQHIAEYPLSWNPNGIGLLSIGGIIAGSPSPKWIS